MTPLFLGLLAAMMIGGSDATARYTAQRVSLSVLFLCIMGASTIALGGWMALNGRAPVWDAYGWAVSAGSGFLNILALFFLYRALARGPVSVASPAASTFTIMLIGMNALAGQPFHWAQGAAAMLVFGGIVMLTRSDDGGDYDARWLRITAAYGLATALTVSVRMFLAQEAGTALGPFDALFLNRMFAFIAATVLILALMGSGTSLNWPRGAVIGAVALQTVLETASLGTFLAASADGGRIAATIGFSTFAAATVIFAWIFLGERVPLRKMAWVLAVGGGVALAAAVQP